VSEEPVGASRSRASMVAARSAARASAWVRALVVKHGRAPVVAAVFLGLLSGGVAWASIRAREREVRAGWDLVPVLVAAQDLPEGSTLALEMVARRDVPEQFVTSSVVRPDSAATVLGQKLLVPVQAGDPLLWSAFEVARGVERLSAVVQRRARAVTIETSEAQAVGGWVRPNDHVDVIATFREPGTDELSTLTLLQNVVVVATGDVAGPARPHAGDDGVRNVSLLLLPEEVELAVLAQELGRLTLVLRNPEDIEVQEDRTRTTLSTLLTGERTRALQKLRRETIQVIRGGAP
jgi:pilus assembly protein CpaB